MPHETSFTFRFAVAAWSAVLIGVCVHALIRPERNSVYPIFAEAGRDWRAGGELYEEDPKPFRYSPLVAAVFAPLTLLPDRLGSVVWRLLNVAVLLTGLFAWRRRLLPRSLTDAQWGLLLLLVLPLAAINLHNGQSNALVLGLLLHGVAAAACGRWSLTALTMAGATLLKLYPLAVGLLLVAIANELTSPKRKRGRPFRSPSLALRASLRGFIRQPFAPRFTLALLVGLALPFAMQSPDYVFGQYSEWVHHLAKDHRHDLTPDLWYRDFRSLLLFAGVSVEEPVWRIVQLLTAALCALLCWSSVRAKWSIPSQLRLLLALGCFWMTLFGPATEATTYLLLAPTAAWIVVEAWAARRRLIVKGLAIAGHVLMLASLMAVWFPFGREALPQELRPAGAVLLLVAVLTVELPRFGRSQVREAARLEARPRLDYTVSVPTK